MLDGAFTNFVFALVMVSINCCMQSYHPRRKKDIMSWLQTSRGKKICTAMYEWAWNKKQLFIWGNTFMILIHRGDWLIVYIAEKSSNVTVWLAIKNNEAKGMGKIEEQCEGYQKEFTKNWWRIN